MTSDNYTRFQHHYFLRISSIFNLLIMCTVFFSCSLKYDETVNAEEANPEFIFYNTQLSRYENNKKKAGISTEYIEQYKNSDSTYARNVEFNTIDKDGKTETEGKCGLLYFDSKKELYELYDGIKLFNTKQNTNFYADILRWNGKTEQLTSGRTDMVRLEKEGTVIVGSGFSASGISGRYNFTGSVSGNIVTKSDEEKGEEQK